MGFFDRKEPEQQVMDMFASPPMALLSLYGLINQGRQNVENNLSTLMQPEALKEKLLSPVPNYWGNLSNPEARNRLTDIATEQALNFGPLPIASIESAISKGIQIKNKPAFDKLEQRVGLSDMDVYHGTGGTWVGQLDSSKNMRGYIGKGTHVSTEPDLANYYASQHGANQRVMPLQIKAGLKFADENLAKEVQYKIRAAIEDGVLPPTSDYASLVRKELERQGYAGVKYAHPRIYNNLGNTLSKSNQSMTSYLVFDSNNLIPKFK